MRLGIHSQAVRWLTIEFIGDRIHSQAVRWLTIEFIGDRIHSQAVRNITIAPDPPQNSF